MADRTLERIKAYLVATEGFEVIEVVKTNNSQHLMVKDVFGFTYSIDLTPLGRIAEPAKDDRAL